jgi:hypothetical protein
MERARVALAASCLTLAAGVSAAHAASPPTPWDGKNPFRCTLQQAGFGTTVPDPGADPYCVEFDKRRQNITQLGIVDFLSKEPARVAAAVPKCFYFQSDHWRGSIVQGAPATKTYEWDGHYFFDKAKGEGGVWVTKFNIGGQSFNPTLLPGFPARYDPYFGYGTGGFRTHDDIPGDPRCAARARREGSRIYASPARPAGPSRCMTAAGSVGVNRLGPVGIGDRESQLRRSLGPPQAIKRGFLRWCVLGGGRFLAGQATDRSGELGDDPARRTVVLLSSSRAFRYRGIGRGSRLRTLRRRLGRARRLTRLGRTRLYVARPGSRVLFGVRARRVAFVAVRDRRAVHGRRGVRRYVRRAR